MSFFFFFNDTATTEIYTLSLHDALPIFNEFNDQQQLVDRPGSHRFPEYFSLNVQLEKRFHFLGYYWAVRGGFNDITRSEEHTSELQSQSNLVCRLLLEKKKTTTI